MKTIKQKGLIGILLILTLCSTLQAAILSTFFVDANGIPHLPVVDATGDIVSPVSGMLVYSIADASPMVYSGSAWDNFCTSNIPGAGNSGYFKVSGGIPIISVLAADPAVAPSGNVYYSSGSGKIRVSNGSVWNDYNNLSGVTDNSGFSAGSNLVKFPVLAAAPSGISQGATYYSSASNSLHYYNGSAWEEVSCSITAPDGTPVVDMASPSGRTWMDRNLGASQKATSSTDYLGYGSHFQWCREADGHEKINWTSSTSGNYAHGTTTTLSTTTSPGHSNFIMSYSSPNNDWLFVQQSDGSLWWDGSTAGANSPCPVGYHVPTRAEWADEEAIISANGNNATAAFDHLALPLAGHRQHNGGTLRLAGSEGYYLSSTVNGITAYSLYFYSGSASMNSYNRGYGMSVRCIKD